MPTRNSGTAGARSIPTPPSTSDHLTFIFMPHIDLPKEYPGVRSLFMFRPETAAPLNALAYRGPHAVADEVAEEIPAAQCRRGAARKTNKIC